MQAREFLAGYGCWLVRHRWRILGIVLVSLFGFLGALWLTAVPQDPFTYELF